LKGGNVIGMMSFFMLQVASYMLHVFEASGLDCQIYLTEIVETEKLRGL